MGFRIQKLFGHAALGQYVAKIICHHLFVPVQTKISKAPKIAREFAKISLGDFRLERRLLRVVGRLNANPSAETVNGTFEGWAETKATYRLFSNENCQAEKLIEPHIRQTVARMKNYKTVLVISDTTFVNYNGHPKTVGLGSIGRYGTGKKHSQGLILHVTYAVAPNGLPLGVLSIKVWTRPPEGYGKDTDAREKESLRWIEEMEKAFNRCPKGTKMIYIADRESDIYGIFKRAAELGIEIVVRSKHDRRIKGDGLRIEDALNNTSPEGRTVVEVNTVGGKRKAILEITRSNIKICRPGDATQKGSDNKEYVDLGVISVKEVNCPKEEKLYWRLLTTLPLDNLEKCLKVVSIYKQRWLIELLFKAAKSGCKIESCRLQRVEGIVRYLYVMFVIAWRLSWKVYIGRVHPRGDRSLILSGLEYKTLWIISNRKKIKQGIMSRDPPENSPWTAKDIIIAMAMIAGFNGRRRDGMPGMKKIWEGWICLQNATLATEVLL